MADLPAPQSYGPSRGGFTDDKGVVPLGRRAVEDVSRRRSNVFTEVGPEGLRDLLDRDDGMIAMRSRWLDAGGHARLRHGGAVTEERLKRRALDGEDPVSGTTMDWEHGGNHRLPRHATAFASDADAVYAEMAIWDNPAGRAARLASDQATAPLDQVRYTVRVPATDVFGPGFRDHIRGCTRLGSPNNPQGTTPTVFPDDTVIVAVYQRDSPTSPWRAWTLYPKPQ
ncbi:MAG: hypothetical protein ACRDT4_05100 [Micromonosporaceae bacterium]